MKILYAIAILFCGISLRAQMNFSTDDSATNSGPRPPTRIDSDSADFDMNARKAFYHGHVVVSDPQMKLTCAELVADIPQSVHIQQIVAETNVVIDFTGDDGNTNHVTADKAIYNFKIENGATNEAVTFTGHPRATTPQMDITGEPLIWDRAKNAFHATHETIYIHQNLNFMPTNSLPKSNEAKLPPTNLSSNTNKTHAFNTNFPPGTIQNIDDSIITP